MRINHRAGREARDVLVRLGLLAVSAAVLACAMTSPAGAVSNQRDLATEVCEAMVRDAVVTNLGALAQPQSGQWTGDRYACTYTFNGGGTLVLTVDTFRNTARAGSQFHRLSSHAAHRSPLYGIGQQAFENRTGLVVANKDRFVLRVDPSNLDVNTGLRQQASLNAAVAVMGCW